ncbi:MAG TPA: galactokinase [Clostridia bacterium]|nr:galactokinase [Clostridia bacterium]
MQGSCCESSVSAAKTLTERFQRLNGTRPEIFRAPGRVNLIGEHTDYNDGFVMPAALGFYTMVAVARRDDRIVRAYSEQFQESVDLPLDSLSIGAQNHWSDYVRGVAGVLIRSGHKLSGADIMIDGQVPLGAGLSSSAAIEVATALALCSVSNIDMPPIEMARACQKAEHDYAGTHCGIMDQFISIFGRAGHAVMLDCRSLDSKLLPISGDVRMVICNSMVKHALAGGEYNRRRADCETAVSLLGQHLPGIKALRDMTLEQLDHYRGILSETVYRRSRHVISENERVLNAADALTSGDLAGFGRLMCESHTSLRDDYEVSCKELDLLVELARGLEGVFGARMTGGGFGGCTVNLVSAEHVDKFQAAMSEGYQKKTGTTPNIYVCLAAQGAGRVERL